MRCLQTKAEVNELIFWSNGDVCVRAFSFRWDISVWWVWNLLIIWWAICFEGNFKHPLHYCKNSFRLGKHLRDLSQMMKCTWDSAWFHNRSLCVCVCVTSWEVSCPDIHSWLISLWPFICSEEKFTSQLASERGMSRVLNVCRLRVNVRRLTEMAWTKLSKCDWCKTLSHDLHSASSAIKSKQNNFKHFEMKSI